MLHVFLLWNLLSENVVMDIGIDSLKLNEESRENQSPDST